MTGSGAEAMQRAQLLEVATGLYRRLDPVAVGQRIVHGVLHLTTVTGATLVVRDASRWRHLATAGGLRGDPAEAAVARLDHATRLTSAIWLLAPVAGNDATLAVELRDHHARIGVLLLAAAEQSPPDLRVIDAFAGHATTALGNARRHEMARRDARTASELVAITTTMTQSFEFPTILRRIARAVGQRLPTHALSAITFSGATAQVTRTESDGHREVTLPTTRLPLSGALLTLTTELARDGVLTMDDVQSRDDLVDFARPDTRSLLLAGHADAGTLSVALAVASEEPGAFDRDSEAFLSGLVEVSALALRNSRLYAEARRLAERDSLTGLLNRRRFWADLQEALPRATATRPLALAVVDVDDFKAINDGHGHPVGDQALLHVSDRLLRAVRETDPVYRIGGEEFAVLMPGADDAAARRAAARLVEYVRLTRAALPRTVTVSVGVAVTGSAATAPDALYRVADDALYRAKAAGKDRAEAAYAGG